MSYSKGENILLMHLVSLPTTKVKDKKEKKNNKETEMKNKVKVTSSPRMKVNKKIMYRENFPLFCIRKLASGGAYRPRLSSLKSPCRTRRED